MQLEYFFDCSSPWTYLSYTWIESICQQHNAELIWKPILVGGVFNSVNPSVYENRSNPVPPKTQYYQKDLQDWAKYHGITIGAPPVFPVNSVKAMRGAFVAIEQGLISEYAGAVFRAYWAELKDISQDSVLKKIISEVGLNEESFFACIKEQKYKDKLRINTEELIQRGGYGSPTMFVDTDDMYFGNDRQTLIQHRLKNQLKGN